MNPSAPAAALVAQYMHGPVVTIAPTESLETARALLDAQNISSVVVLDLSGAPVGVLSRTDVLHALVPPRGAAAPLPLEAIPVARVMSPGVLTVRPDETVDVACGRMVARHIHRLYVSEHDRPVGVFGTRDAMTALIDRRVAAPIDFYMSKPVRAVQVDEPIGTVLAQLDAAHIGGLVVQEGEWPVGLFTQREALEARAAPPEEPVEAHMTPALLCLQHGTPLHRAAALAMATRARRVLALDGRHVVGLLTGLDFCRALAAG
jgi:predicted transcriptional regulator